MGRVRYNQSGYDGCSMSERARSAYADGEMPKSKWTKKAMIDAIEDYCEEEGLELTEGALNLNKQDMFRKLFEWKSWHHTGKFANETDFYGIDEEAIQNISVPIPEEEMVRRLEERLEINRLQEIRNIVKRVENSVYESQRNKIAEEHGLLPSPYSGNEYSTLYNYLKLNPGNVKLERSRNGNLTWRIGTGEEFNLSLEFKRGLESRINSDQVWSHLSLNGDSAFHTLLSLPEVESYKVLAYRHNPDLKENVQALIGSMEEALVNNQEQVLEEKKDELAGLVYKHMTKDFEAMSGTTFFEDGLTKEIVDQCVVFNESKYPVFDLEKYQNLTSRDIGVGREQAQHKAPRLGDVQRQATEASRELNSGRSAQNLAQER